MLWLDEEEALFTGDNVLGWGTTYVGDLWSYMRSLEKMSRLKPQRLYPAHGKFHSAPHAHAHTHTHTHTHTLSLSLSLTHTHDRARAHTHSPTALTAPTSYKLI